MSDNNNGDETEVSRRSLMKSVAAAGTAAAAGTTAGVNSMTDVVEAQEGVTSLLGITNQEAAAAGLVGVLSPLAGGAYLYETAFSDDNDSNEQAKEKWSRMYTQAKEIGAKDEIVNTIVSNSYDEFRNAYFIEGKRKAIEAMNDGASKSSVKNQAVNAADENHAAVMQLNLLKYLDVRNQELIRFSKAGRYIKDNYDEDQVDQLFAITMDGGVDGTFSKNLTSIATESQMFDKTFTLFDGSTYTFTGENRQVDDFGNVFLATGPYDSALTSNTNEGSVPDGNPFEIPDFETSDRDQQIDQIYVYDVPGSNNASALLFNLEKWHRAYWTLGKYRNDAASELKTWIDGIYSNYTAGDITQTELVNAYDLSDLSTEGEYSAGSVSLYKLGISTEPGTELTIELNDGTELTGSLFINDEVTLQVGEIYSPGEFNGSVYATYVPQDAGSPGVRKIEQQFKITSAEDADGNEIDSVTFDGANDVDKSSTDVQTLKDELSELRDRNEKLQKRVDSVQGAGGGDDGNGLLDALGDTSPWLLVAGGGGGLWLFSQIFGGD